VVPEISLSIDKQAPLFSTVNVDILSIDGGPNTACGLAQGRPPAKTSGMADEFEWIRPEIVRCARDRRLRTSDFTLEEPVVWKPYEVINPQCGIPFTDITAWHFIADQIEQGCPIAEIVLKKPPGEIGYELQILGAEGCPAIYVKIRIKHGRILGRSFHNSTR
jgi:hypothetical protein